MKVMGQYSALVTACLTSLGNQMGLSLVRLMYLVQQMATPTDSWKAICLVCLMAYYLAILMDVHLVFAMVKRLVLLTDVDSDHLHSEKERQKAMKTCHCLYRFYF